jgi:hypothetical protein
MAEGRFAGVDWASEEHAVCVVDEQGRIVEGRRFKHTENGLRALCARLVGLKVTLVAIERPDGLLIGTVVRCRPHGDRCAPESGQGGRAALLGRAWEVRWF